MSKKGVVQVGQRYGRLVTLRPTEHRYRKSVVWECQCDCGNITEVSAVFLKGGHKKSCGCKYHNRQLVKNGVVYSVEEISKLAGISPSVVYYHIANGASIDDLINHRKKGFKLDKAGNLVDIMALVRETGLARTTIYYRIKKGLIGDELKYPRKFGKPIRTTGRTL